MAGLFEGGNESPGSLKASKYAAPQQMGLNAFVGEQYTVVPTLTHVYQLPFLHSHSKIRHLVSSNCN
ncbi:hypothetical protein ANN_23221 [Periplaneta americana]|uniref:Uncharacterized protein n=1 Tax=Periplaneta americana TaxID=6978 RepID=A0ABQ8SLI5_PERAM|nr:hypothetical protein ANN_23221 [Periplaneta americana]